MVMDRVTMDGSGLYIATGDCHKNNNLILPFKFMVIPYGQRRSTSFLEYVRPEKAIKFWLAIINSKQRSDAERKVQHFAKDVTD